MVDFPSHEHMFFQMIILAMREHWFEKKAGLKFDVVTPCLLMIFVSGGKEADVHKERILNALEINDYKLGRMKRAM